MTGDEASIYVYSTLGYPFDTTRLNKIDPETGKTIWSTGYFEEISIYPPIIIGDLIYATLHKNVILCFDSETGTQLARIKLTRDSQNIYINSNYYFYKDYFYFGFTDTIIDRSYLGRVNINLVMKDGDPQEQLVEPEVLWQSRYNRYIFTGPFVYNDTVYCNTITTNANIPVELAGIDINTKEEVLYDTFGINGSYFSDHGWEINSFYEKDGILYYLGESIAAYDTRDNRKLYHIMFDFNTPHNRNYGFFGSLDATFYKDRIYYTTVSSNYFGDEGFRNIFCVNEKDGKLVWSAIPRRCEALGGKPILYDDKVFVPYSGGICVYNAGNGKLIGVEKSIEGAAVSFNQLYGSIMITARESDAFPDGQIIALDLKR
jgi:outer membrane protein assembly factor BamB